MNNRQAVMYEQQIPDILGALGKIHGVIDSHKLDRRLYHLILLRASQINGCGYCVEMHTREARDDGETSERLDRLVVWEQVDVFSAREKVALAWTEAVTKLDRPVELGELRGRLREQFTDKEISLLTANIAMINLWNRIQISGH